jgi:UDP-N-acetylmuramoyl-L-alanyl-D-glutamate--2,6-diaminopimelate ligase
MVHAGLSSAAIEVSSHALVQGRVDEVEFDVGVYTNLTEDHLDYHGTMEEYAKAKSLLFQNLKPEGYAIYNRDCPYYERIVEGTKAHRLSYGIDNKADLQAHSISLSPEGTTFTIAYQGKEKKVFSPLVGKHNVLNGLAAVGVALVSGIPFEEVVGKVETFPQVPGRLDKVDNPLGLTVYVDFAHTGKSLETVLECIKTFARGRIIVLFGCGGDRDPGRRTLMARAVEKYADLVVVTSDNPRTEDPEAIIDQILTAFESKDNVHRVCDRRKAIAMAIQMATPEDVLLLAGRGHERFQIVGQQTIPFDDREVAREACMQMC